MEFEDSIGSGPSNLPRAWDNAHAKDTRIISERVPDHTVLEITESNAYFHHGVGNNVSIRAWGNVTILGDVGHGVSIGAGNYVRISADAGDNLVLQAKGTNLRKAGRDAVISVQDEVYAISFGAGSVIEARSHMVIRDLCGRGCRFISPIRRGLGITSPECRQQDHRPNEFWRSTLGLR